MMSDKRCRRWFLCKSMGHINTTGSADKRFVCNSLIKQRGSSVSVLDKAISVGFPVYHRPVQKVSLSHNYVSKCCRGHREREKWPRFKATASEDLAEPWCTIENVWHQAETVCENPRKSTKSEKIQTSVGEPGWKECFRYSRVLPISCLSVWVLMTNISSMNYHPKRHQALQHWLDWFGKLSFLPTQRNDPVVWFKS